jgi:DNA-binding PadR family transcriptional regulator
MGQVELHILMSLSRQPCHGYEMMKQISRASDGDIEPGPGTLYVALRRLMDNGEIRELDRQAQTRSRRRYCITRAGKASLRRELDRLAQLLQQAEGFGWRNRLLRDP